MMGLGAMSTGHAAIISDGSFTNGLTGWTSTGDVVGATFGSLTPSTVAEFGSTGGLGSLSQNFTTIAGTNYELTFLPGAYGEFTDGQITYAILDNTTSNIILSNSFTYVVGPSNVTVSSTGGAIYALAPTVADFQGNGDLYTLLLSTAELPGETNNALVSAVAVNAIPEPMSMVLMLSAVVGLGFVRARKAG